MDITVTTASILPALPRPLYESGGVSSGPLDSRASLIGGLPSLGSGWVQELGRSETLWGRGAAHRPGMGLRHLRKSCVPSFQ